MKEGQNAVMIFRFDNTDNALKVLGEKGINVFTGEEVYAM